MKKIYPLLLLLATTVGVFSQDYDGFNKKELRILLAQTTKNLEDISITLENTTAALRKEEALARETKSNLQATIKELESKLGTTNLNLKVAKDSVARLAAKLERTNNTLVSIKRTIAHGSGQNSSDFLNNYFFNTTPLDNNQLRFQLSQILVGNLVHNNDRYNNNYNQTIYTPEFLTPDKFEIFKGKKNKYTKEVSSFKNAIELLNIDAFDALMPKVEILKNKLVTLTYKDGIEENFLYTLQPNDADNNFRKTYQLQLANEAVLSNDNYDKKNDIMWTMLCHDNDCYLALNYKQLQRLKFTFLQEDYVQAKTENSKRSSVFKTNSFGENVYNDNTITTGEGIYFKRIKDAYMDADYFFNYEDLIFLFKLR